MFFQARSIQELANKDFENLRQDSDDNEPEPKVVRRGRPPTKNLKKPLGRPSLERAGSEFSSDATLATGGENTPWTNNDLRKGSHPSDRSGLADSSGRFHGSRNNDAHASWLADSKFEKNDDFTGLEQQLVCSVFSLINFNFLKSLDISTRRGLMDLISQVLNGEVTQNKGRSSLFMTIIGVILICNLILLLVDESLLCLLHLMEKGNS